MSPHKVFSLCLHLLDVDTAWHLETETSQLCLREPGSWSWTTCITQTQPLAWSPSTLGTSSHQPPSLVVTLVQLDVQKEMARGAAEEAPEQARAARMLTPPLLPEPVLGCVQFSKDFTVHSQGSDFADGFVACTCPNCKTQTDLEVLKAALLFSNYLNSTYHLCLIKKHNFKFSWGVSAATLKVTWSLN